MLVLRGRPGAHRQSTRRMPLTGAGRPSDLAVDEGLDGLDGGDHLGLGGTGEGGDDAADVLGTPAASRSGASESV